MGRGQSGAGGRGKGYPISFRCAVERRERNSLDGARREHKVTRTGRSRPTPRGKGHPRKSWTTWEYRCSCGHVGWTNHVNIERYHPIEEI